MRLGDIEIFRDRTKYSVRNQVCICFLENSEYGLYGEYFYLNNYTRDWWALSGRLIPRNNVL